MLPSLRPREIPHFVRTISTALLVVIGLGWAVMRFVGLEAAPRGFWMDETWDATHALCLAETGRDADGKVWPLFSGALAGGTLPITWTAPMAAWTRLFGSSIRSFRTPSALWVLVTSAALFGLAKSLLRLTPNGREPSSIAEGRPFPWLVLFAALVSPWSFQFSRIAWEGPLGPAFLSLSVLAMVRLVTSGGWIWAVVCGVCGGASMISYPPLRAAAPLILTVAGGALIACADGRADRRRRWVRIAAAAWVLLATFSPVIVMIARGEGIARMMDVSIFSPDWLERHHGVVAKLPFFVITLIDNLFQHLRPSYLFFLGDMNHRHSAHVVGELSPVDILALGVFLGAVSWLVGLAARQVTGRTVAWPRASAVDPLLAIVALLCIVAGMFASVPAALTWDGVPHALRSIGAWPFVALFTGAVLSAGWERLRWLPPAVAVVAVVYTLAFFPDYFRAYARAELDVFHRDIPEALAAARAHVPPRTARDALAPLAQRYDDYILRYFLMHDAGLSCERAKQVFSEMRGSR